MPKILLSREKWLLRGLIVVIVLSVLLLISNSYLGRTQAEPRMGGKYTEGLLGQPRYINPILSQTNDADRDIVRLVFSSLLKYDNKGELILDLAESYEVDEKGLTYDIYLKKDVIWHNGEPLTVEDVLFTIKTIQNTEYKSPLKAVWEGVELEKIDDYAIRFRIQNPYAPFLHNLTVGILPKHLWGGISAQNFPLADYNLRPIGSGPYKFEKLNKSGDDIESIKLVRNENYYVENKPYIETIVLKFYNNQTDLINAYNKGQIEGFPPLSAASQLDFGRRANAYEINMPLYHAIFFNQTESRPLADKNVRIALVHAVNKEELINNILQGKGTALDSPFPPNWLNSNSEDITRYEFDLEKAKTILEDNEWTDNDNDGIREKKIDSSDEEATILEISLITTDWPELSRTAQILKEQWEKIGARINIEIVDSISIQQDYIRPRNYQALLFGEILGADPDPFAFWHSSQKRDPGLNLSLYQNKDADKHLETGRQTLTQEERIKEYVEFEKIITKDIPAIFLYTPTYLYPVTKSVKGISLEKIALPSHRFSQIENWYIKTKRIDK